MHSPLETLQTPTPSIQVNLKLDPLGKIRHLRIVHHSTHGPHELMSPNPTLI